MRKNGNFCWHYFDKHRHYPQNHHYACVLIIPEQVTEAPLVMRKDQTLYPLQSEHLG